MDELIVKQHNFQKAKKQLKKFSEEIPEEVALNKVDNDKGFGEFVGDLLFGRGLGLDHKVTGEELNELTSEIQTHLHSINETQIKLIKEFGQVYNALENLDKGYIEGILTSIKATEKTSEEIVATQEKIAAIVDDQSTTIEILKKFKKKLDDCAHLEDIDKLWHESQEQNEIIQNISTETKVISDSSEKLNKKLKFLYLISGGALGLALCELIYIIIQVI